MERDLQTKLLPNGKEYCAELARTEKAKDECTGDLEDVVYVSNRDKARAKETLRTGVDRIKLARNPCSFWEKLTRNDRCKITRGD